MFTPDQWLAVVSIFAVALSPIAALELQKRMDDRRAKIDRKMAIFRKLMTTRATQMSPVHVEALNAIEVEFYAVRGADKKVLDAWHLYVNHLNSKTGEGDALARWVEKKDGLLVDLLYEMAQRLGYDIDKVTIQKNAYYPRGHWDIEVEQHALRKAALAVFSGERPIQTTVVGRVQTSGPLPLAEEIRPDLEVGQPVLPVNPRVCHRPPMETKKTTSQPFPLVRYEGFVEASASKPNHPFRFYAQLLSSSPRFQASLLTVHFILNPWASGVEAHTYDCQIKGIAFRQSLRFFRAERCAAAAERPAGERDNSPSTSTDDPRRIHNGSDSRQRSAFFRLLHAALFIECLLLAFMQSDAGLSGSLGLLKVGGS
jgi:hypothetical protein